MNSEQARLVERLHQALVEEIRTRRPEYLRQPFTVAEIYQELVPYRNYRDQIGAAMNGDYEDALLRLLSGTGGYLVLESEPARKRLLDELSSNNPNTGIFREYAALDVRLNQARLPTDPPPASTPPAAPPAASAPPSTASVSVPPSTASAPPSTASAPPQPAATPPKGAATSATPSPPSGATASVAPRMEQQMQNSSPQRAQPASASPKPSETAAARASTAPAGQPGRTPAAGTGQPTGDTTPCRWCREELPRREKLRFCPFCGMDVNLVPCRACGEELEPQWRFCVACGTQVAAEE